MKMKADAKSFVSNFFGNWVNKADGTVKGFNSVYYNNCLQSSEIKAYTKTLSARRICNNILNVW